MQLMNDAIDRCRAPGGLDFGTSMRMAPEISRELIAMAIPMVYQEQKSIFSENQTGRGVYVVLDGQVKLSVNSAEGRRLSLCIARKGEILGLSSALLGGPYEMTAETLFPTRVAHISRKDLLRFIEQHPEAHQALMLELSRQYSMACDQLRTLGLSASAPERLARFLLHWSESGVKTDGGTCSRFSLTHEAVGECIGASRATVTRTLTTFRNKRLVLFKGSTLTIPDMNALAVLAGSQVE